MIDRPKISVNTVTLILAANPVRNANPITKNPLFPMILVGKLYRQRTNKGEQC